MKMLGLAFSHGADPTRLPLYALERAVSQMPRLAEFLLERGVPADLAARRSSTVSPAKEKPTSLAGSWTGAPTRTASTVSTWRHRSRPQPEPDTRRWSSFYSSAASKASSPTGQSREAHES